MVDFTSVCQVKILHALQFCAKNLFAEKNILHMCTCNWCFVKVSATSCTCGGDTPGSQIYKPDYDQGCTRYSQYIGEGNAPGIYINCPTGLIFDVESCSCNYNWAASCNLECKGGWYCQVYFALCTLLFKPEPRITANYLLSTEVIEIIW